MVDTIERCAKAIAEVRKRYRVETNLDRRPRITGPAVVKYDSFTPVAVVFHGTEAECQAWIDEQAARACVAALLPLSGEMVEDARDAYWNENDPIRAVLTAAITAVLEGKA
jgi:hypothetical protein